MRWKLTALILLVLFLNIGCDPPQGPRVAIHNLTDMELVVHVNDLPASYVDVDGRLDRPFLGFSGQRGDVYEPMQLRRMYQDNAARRPLETKYIVTAVINDSIVFQRVFTGHDFEDPATVIEIVDERPA